MQPLHIQRQHCLKHNFGAIKSKLFPRKSSSNAAQNRGTTAKVVVIVVVYMVVVYIVIVVYISQSQHSFQSHTVYVAFSDVCPLSISPSVLNQTCDFIHFTTILLVLPLHPPPTCTHNFL